jgi:hypothetical protein
MAAAKSRHPVTFANRFQRPSMQSGLWQEWLGSWDPEKPSDGLEPSSPSLPFRFRRGKRGHARVSEGTKAPQAGVTRRRYVTRVWTRVAPLVFAPCSHGSRP